MDQPGSVLPFPHALYVSQPALSRQIRGLEQLVGCELLRRSTHSVELTIAGEALLDRSRRLLRDVDEAVAAALAVGGVSPGEGHHPTVLYLHGGGYVVGSAFGYQPHAGALAASAHTGVLVVDYRLAPEHPFRAALEDAQRAYLWLREQTPDREAVIVAGDSSGGALLLSLLLALKRDDPPLPAAAVIFCPWLDLALRMASPSDAPLATDEDVRRCVEAYLAGHPADDPIVDPLRADLGGLPPMLIQAATGDARLVDAKALASHAQDHGVDARLELFPVDAHAFQLFWSFLPEAADAVEAAGAFIREAAAVHGQRVAVEPMSRQ